MPQYPQAYIFFFGCTVIGVVVSYMCVIITQYYTDYNFGPARCLQAMRFATVDVDGWLKFARKRLCAELRYQAHKEAYKLGSEACLVDEESEDEDEQNTKPYAVEIEIAQNTHWMS